MAEDIREMVNGLPVERRLFPRLVASVDVEYKILAKGISQEEKTLTKNISAGGICLIVYEKLQIGTLLGLKIYFSEINCVITAKGTVVWTEQFTISSDKRERYDVGIEFTEISKSDRQKISQYVFKLIK